MHLQVQFLHVLSQRVETRVHISQRPVGNMCSGAINTVYT